MTALLARIRNGLRQHAAYRRTKAEIANMPLATAIDLDIYPPDAPKIAARAVYGPKAA